MGQGLMRNNRAHKINGGWAILWNGDYTPVSEDEAMRFNAQEPQVLQLAVGELTGHALAWAVANALGYDPFITVDDMPGKMLGGGVVQMSYEDQVVIAHFSGRRHFGPFRPSTDYVKGGPLLDEHRVSTEVAGDGWGALYNDTFCVATQSKVIHGATRLEAGLRCIAARFLGAMGKVSVPAELVPANVRRRHLALAG